MPYKRYLLPEILRLGKQYLHNSEQTYRSVVQHEKTQIIYSSESDKQLSHSSVWTWLSYLGGFSDSVFQAVQLMLNKVPDCNVHRNATPVSHRKYRGERRKIILLNSEVAIRVNEYLNSLYFSHNIFPRVLNTG